MKKIQIFCNGWHCSTDDCSLRVALVRHNGLYWECVDDRYATLMYKEDLKGIDWEKSSLMAMRYLNVL